MQYNQPFGISDPNAGYINGNPEIGQQGSIPPAFSIEHDQREIVAVIQWAYDHGYVDQYGNPCLAPTSSLLDQLLKALFGVLNSRLLRAPQVYYVNGTTGSDTNDGLTATTAFLTIQHALNVAVTWNQNGFPLTINVADGSYAGITLPQLNGSGGCVLQGSGTGTCIISGVNKSAISQFEPSASYLIQGFALASAGVGVPGDHMSGIMMYAGNNAMTDIKFLSCVGPHAITISNSVLNFNSNMTSSTNKNHIEIAAPGLLHLYAVWGSKIVFSTAPDQPILDITAAVNFADCFWRSDEGALIAGQYLSITGAASVTGQRYNATLNGVIAVNGSGVSYLPGTIAGVTASGGQYG
jgi:hypothetical protein